MEDLFGDEVDAEIDNQKPTVEKVVEEHEEDEPAAVAEDEDLFGDDGFIEDDEAENNQEHDYEQAEVEPEEIITRYTVANHKLSKTDSKALYLAKLPSFLDFNSYPYDPDTLLAEIQQSTEESADNDEKMTKKRSLVNTLRWRHEQKEDGTFEKVSNARFVKWSDGSMSLQVGEELFDVPMKNITKDHNYLTLMHAEEGMLRGMQRFSHSMTFQPYGLSSKSHAELKADIARRAITSKSRTVKLHNELIDPAEIQRQAIRADNERQKARRRLDNQKARAMNYSGGSRDRTQLTASYLDDSDEELGSGAQRYTDENEDGFIENDEDEDEAASSRLQALKEAGAADYRNRKAAKRSKQDSEDGEESEDESIVYEDGAGDDSEEEAVMTPKERSPARDPEPEPEVSRTKKLKRRIADSDEDDE